MQSLVYRRQLWVLVLAAGALIRPRTTDWTSGITLICSSSV